MEHQEHDEQQNAGEEQASGSAANETPDREQVLRETREAGMRAEGGGSADEEEIREAAKQE